MLVVIAIIGIITLVVILGQGSFNRSIILSNAAYDVALSLRSTQSYGLSSRIESVSNTHTGYGLEFTLGKTFVFFGDTYPAQTSACHPTPPAGTNAPDAKWGDCVYTSRDTYITTYTLGKGITIQDICAYVGNTRYCASQNQSQNHLAKLDVIFVRPDPLPFMSKDGVYSSGAPVTAACLKLVSSDGGAKYVSVAATGEIDANAAPCTP